MFKKHRLSALVLLSGGFALAAIAVTACTDNTVDVPQVPDGSIKLDAAGEAQNGEAAAEASTDTGADGVVDSALPPSDAGDAGDG